MSKLTFLSNNHVLGASFSMLVGSQNAQFPLTNIDKTFTTKVFRSNESTCTIQIDLGSSQSIDTIMLVGSNVEGLGITSATVEFSPTTVFPGTSIETIDLSQGHNVGFKYFTSGSYRYAKLVLTGTTYCELSNLYIGARTEFDQQNLDVGSFSYQSKENFKATANKYGQQFIDKYNKTQTISGEMKYLNHVERESLDDLYAELGNTIPVWFILDSDGCLSSDTSSKYLFSGYYYLTGAMQFKSAAPGLFNTSIKLIEVV